MKIIILFLLCSLSVNNNAQSYKWDKSNLNDHKIITNNNAEQKNGTNVIPKQVTIISMFVDFISNPFASAILSSIFTFIITNYFNIRKKKKEDLANYKTLLSTTKNELEFYNDKLHQLSDEARKIITAIGTNSNPIIPTYSLYPKFLENSKINLNKFYRNIDIVKRIGHCHFELSHIQERLELIKKELRILYDPQLQISNVGGFKGLVDSNIIEFQGMINDINSELKKIKS